MVGVQNMITFEGYILLIVLYLAIVEKELRRSYVNTCQTWRKRSFAEVAGRMGMGMGYGNVWVLIVRASASQLLSFLSHPKRGGPLSLFTKRKALGRFLSLCSPIFQTSFA